MEYLNAAITLLLSPTSILALLLYTLLTFLSEWSGAYLAQRYKEGPGLIWLLERLYIPWFNLLALALFITVLYPQIFGVAELAEIKPSLKRLADISLFISLLLPLIPVIGRAEFALPLQGIIIVSTIFRGLNEPTTHIAIDYWPGWSTIGLMLTISLGTMFLSRLSATHLGEWLDQRLQRRGFERALQHGIQLALQSPVIFIYAIGLGGQLNG
jgi:hypothetical protein